MQAMFCGRTEKLTLPFRPSGRHIGAHREAGEPDVPPFSVPSRKLVRPMKPATNRVLGRL